MEYQENVAHVSLFDKLIDDNAEEAFEKMPRKYLTMHELEKSIQMDLTKLLNTRVGKFWNGANLETSPYSYGINITADILPDDVGGLEELERKIEAVIAKFETRLKGPRVSIFNVVNDCQRLQMIVDALLECGHYRAHVSFPLVVEK